MRLLVWALLVLFLGFYVTIGGTYPWLGLGSARALTHAGFGILAIVWALLAWRSPAWRPSPTLAAAVILVVLVASLSAVLSPVPRIALESVFAGGCLAGAFLFFTCLARDGWFRPRLTSLLVLFAVLLVVAYAAETIYGWVSWYALTGSLALPLRPGGASLTFGAIAAIAAFILLVVPFAFAVLWPTRARPIGIGLAAIALLELAITGSRAAYLGAGVAGAVVAVYWLRGRSGVLRQEALQTLRRALLVGVPAGVLVMVIFAGPLVARLFDVGTVSERFAIWESAAKLFLRHPVIGNGPGTWPILTFETYPSDTRVLVVSHAHDTVVQLAVDFGLVGLTAMAVLLVMVGRSLNRATRSETPGIRYPSVAILAGFAGFATLSVFDHLVNLGALVLVIAILAAWSLGAPDAGMVRVDASRRRPSEAFGRLGVVLLVLAAATAALPVAVSDRAAFTAERGIEALERGDWRAAESQFAAAVAEDPGYLFYSYELAAVQALNGKSAEARAGFARLASVNRAPWVLISLAYLDLEQGDKEAAAEHARMALDRGSGDAEIALNVGVIAEATGNAVFALSARSIAIASAPTIAGSPYWSTTSTPAASLNAAARSILKAKNDPMADIAAALVSVYGGDIPGGRQELLRLPGSIDVSRALAVADFEEGNESAAMDQLKGILDSAPGDIPTLKLLARYSAVVGEKGASKRYLEWIGLLGGSYTGWAEFEPTGRQITTAGEALTSNFPGAYPWAVFLRKAPPLLTPPNYLVIEDVL